MKFLILILQLIMSINCIAQRIEKYDFILRDTFADEKGALDVNKLNFKFSHIRFYVNDSIFREEAFFYSQKTPFDTFKIIQSKWFLKNQGEWKLFFDSGKAVSSIFDKGQSISFKLKYSIKWFDLDTFCGVKAYKFTFVPEGFKISQYTYYYFSPEYGIIGLGEEGLSGHIIIRKDIREKGRCGKCYYCR